VDSGWRGWIVHRFGLKEFADAVLHRRVAKGSWYYGDGATLTLLFGVLLVTGAFMTPSYAPTPDAAYESVEHITHRQILGWFVRGLHYWSAGLMVVMVFFHLFRQILVAGYKSPREGMWLIGIVLFVLVLINGYTGYLLRWDERAVYGIRVALHMFHRVPLIGDAIVVFVQGGEEPSTLTLTRLYSVHVIFVPLLMLALVGWHLYLVMLHSITTMTEREVPVHSVEEQKRIYEQDAHSEKRGETFYPDTTLSSGAFAFVVFLMAVGLTIFVGAPELQPEGNFVREAYPAEEWWFWWISGLIALLPPRIVPYFYVLFPLAVLLGLILLPFLDRSPWRGIKKRPVWAMVVAICVLGMIYLSDYRRRSPFTGWPSPEVPPIPVGFELSAEAEEGRQLFATYGCNSCHPIAGHGRQFAQDLARIEGKYSPDELRKYVLNPPAGVAMPAYEGHITERDLTRIVEFVLVAQTFPREQ
jgi:quinol-cytochrome oxidoreductase complex cytochrome b subunit